MITRNTWNELDTAIREPQKKPNPVTPEVEIVLIGEYEVLGTSGRYQVRIGLNEYHKPYAACTCKGGLHGRACRHIKAAWPLHMELIMAQVSQ